MRPRQVTDLAGRLLCAAELADQPQEAGRAGAAARTRQGTVARRRFFDEAQDNAVVSPFATRSAQAWTSSADGEQRGESYSNRFFATALEPSTSIIPAPRLTL